MNLVLGIDVFSQSAARHGAMLQEAGLCGQVLTGEVERLRNLLEEKDTLITQWRQEAHAAQEAADAASHAVREAEEYSLQAWFQCLA